MSESNFRELCQELLHELCCSYRSWDLIEGNYSDAMKRANAALATPPPLAPNYIDPEHHGEDRELLQVFYAACNAEGGTADEIHLRGIRAVMAACPALATPPPGPLTRKELEEFAENFEFCSQADFGFAVLRKWGQSSLFTQPAEWPTIIEILALIDEIDEAGLGQIDLVRAALERWDRPATPPPEPLPLPDHWNLIGFAFGREPWATWLQQGGCLESAHRELSDLMLAVLAHWGRPATSPPEPPTDERIAAAIKKGADQEFYATVEALAEYCGCGVELTSGDAREVLYELRRPHIALDGWGNEKQ